VVLKQQEVQDATGAVMNIVGGPDMSLDEVNAAAAVVKGVLTRNATFIVGTSVDPKASEGGEITVTLVCTGYHTGPYRAIQQAKASAASAVIAAGQSGGKLLPPRRRALALAPPPPPGSRVGRFLGRLLGAAPAPAPPPFGQGQSQGGGNSSDKDGVPEFLKRRRALRSTE